MSFLDSLPDEATLVDMFWRYPHVGQPLLALHDAIMRAPSPFTAAEREAIATYVSKLNSCSYCEGVHGEAAIALDDDTQHVRAICMGDRLSSNSRLTPVLSYVAKLTKEPSSVTRADVAKILEAGWDETAVSSVIFVTALYAFMNRVIEGHGIIANEEYHRTAGERLADIGYAGLAALLTKGQ